MLHYTHATLINSFLFSFLSLALCHFCSFFRSLQTHAWTVIRKRIRSWASCSHISPHIYRFYSSCLGGTDAGASVSLFPIFSLLLLISFACECAYARTPDVLCLEWARHLMHLRVHFWLLSRTMERWAEREQKIFLFKQDETLKNFDGYDYYCFKRFITNRFTLYCCSLFFTSFIALRSPYTLVHTQTLHFSLAFIHSLFCSALEFSGNRCYVKRKQIQSYTMLLLKKRTPTKAAAAEAFLNTFEHLFQWKRHTHTHIKHSHLKRNKNVLMKAKCAVKCEINR